MLDFVTVHVPVELQSRWDEIYYTTKRILNANPTIIKYWIYIRRDSFYRRLWRSKIKCTDNVWMKLLASNNNISLHDVAQVYQFIRTTVHLVITDTSCTLPYYAQTKQNKEATTTTTITLSGRLLESDSNSFVFVAAAVLLRELTRAIWPICLTYKDAKLYLRNSLFYSWTGIPFKLWPDDLKKRHQRFDLMKGLYYVTKPCSGISSSVTDAGNLFQHVFYNGEVNLYDDIDDRNGQIITQLAIKTHDTRWTLCAARYLDEKFLKDFFNVHQYSLDVVRHLKDQQCPYYKYKPGMHYQDAHGYYLVVDDTPLIQRWSFRSGCYLPRRGPCYEFKPYHPYEPRQFYEHTFITGHPSVDGLSKCCRVSYDQIGTDDPFFVENRLLFRRGPSLSEWYDVHNDCIEDELVVSGPPRYSNDDDVEDETPKEIKKTQSIIIPTWRSWLNRIQDFFNKLTNKDIKRNKKQNMIKNALS